MDEPSANVAVLPRVSQVPPSFVIRHVYAVTCGPSSAVASAL